MRLVCPNCSAQYEVDASLIPDEGRDVQCSNCGHTWFELPPPPAEFAEADLRSEDTSTEEEAPEPEVAEPDERRAEPSQAVKAIAAATEASDDDETEAEEDDAFFAPPVQETKLKPRRPADAAALDILREEAAREISQRRAPPSEPIETQTDLGLDEVRNRNTPSRALRARMAHLKDDEKRPASESDRPSEADYQAPRRDLLPDIDEINSTLKPARGREASTSAAVAEHRGGFRTGFLIMVMLTIALILAYARAPGIARALPAFEPALLSYVDGANTVRDWIDGLLANPE